MIDYNYHTHTSRCGHAQGTDREYIEAAITRGIKVLGFSDHILFEHKNEESKAKFLDYIDSLTKLKEEYKDKIEIYIGFECEHFEDRVEYFNYLLKEKVDYLILGQHHITDKHGNRLDMFNELENPHKIAKRYYLCVKAGLKSGLYKYLAHPDLYTREFKEIDKVYFKYAKKICKVAKKYNVPIEINLNGLYYREVKNITTPTYPYEQFFEIAGKVGNNVIIGVDAHSPELILNAKYEWAENIIEKYHLHHITRLDLTK